MTLKLKISDVYHDSGYSFAHVSLRIKEEMLPSRRMDKLPYILGEQLGLKWGTSATDEKTRIRYRLMQMSVAGNYDFLSGHIADHINLAGKHCVNPKPIHNILLEEDDHVLLQTNIPNAGMFVEKWLHLEHSRIICVPRCTEREIKEINNEYRSNRILKHNDVKDMIFRCEKTSQPVAACFLNIH